MQEKNWGTWKKKEKGVIESLSLNSTAAITEDQCGEVERTPTDSKENAWMDNSHWD